MSLEVLERSPGPRHVLLARKVLDAGVAGSSLLEPCPTLAPGTQVAFPGAESSQVAVWGFICSLYPASHRRNLIIKQHSVLEIALPLGRGFLTHSFDQPAPSLKEVLPRDSQPQ